MMDLLLKSAQVFLKGTDTHLSYFSLKGENILRMKQKNEYYYFLYCFRKTLVYKHLGLLETRLEEKKMHYFLTSSFF